MKRLLTTAAVCVLLGTALTALGDKDRPGGGLGQFLYVSSRTGDPDIYLANADGTGEAKNLTNNTADDVFPAWSFDGKKIAFSSDRDGVQNIYVMDADGKNVKQITQEKEICRAPAWSPDGKKIVFTRHVEGQSPDLFIMDADGKNMVNLTNDPGYDADAAWSPDGKKILFTSLRGGNQGFHLYTMDPDGKNLKELTTEDNGQGFVYPAWSPDGKKIAYAHPMGDALEVFLVDADGKNQKQLSKQGGQNSYAAWSPDGTKIAWHHIDGSGATAIWMMDADGSNQKEVLKVDMPKEGGRIAWQPK
jgi:Tol biopolymer transport system component